MIWTVFAVIWLLWLPGVLLARLFRSATSPDPLVNFAQQIGLSCVFWPVLLLWTTTLGWHWSESSAFVAALLIGIGGLLAFALVPSARWLRRWQRLQKLDIWLISFAMLFATAFQTRLAHIRELVLPNWVDSIHHVMIVRLLVEHGALPDSYAPFMPNGQFFYHWGYHAVVTWLVWFQGQTDAFDIAQQLLSFGQILNTLSALMLYAAGRTLFQSRRAGLFAALLGLFILWFPAYYSSWGRYTHLMGVLILAPLTIALWRLHKQLQMAIAQAKPFGRSDDWTHWTRWTRPLGQWLTVVLLATGIFLIHVRVTFFGLTLAIALALWLLARRAWLTLFAWVVAALATLLLLSPWLPTLFHATQLSQTDLFSTGEAQAGWRIYNAIPWNLVWIPGVGEVMALATGGLSALLGWGAPDLWLRIASGGWCLLLFGIFLSRCRQTRRTQRTDSPFSRAPWLPILLLITWSTLTFILLNLDRWGLPNIGFIHNSAAVITLFVPLSLAGGGLLAWAVGALFPHRFAVWTTLFLLMTIGGWGAYDMQQVINTTTILAEPSDLQALYWIRENTPKEAKFAVNAHRWLATTYAGQDAGYWISVLTDRKTIVPPALYALAEPWESVLQHNDLLEVWAKADSADSPELLAKLHAAGVTHLYIGAKGGHMDVEKLLAQSNLKLIYKNGLVYIFEFQ